LQTLKGLDKKRLDDSFKILSSKNDELRANKDNISVLKDEKDVIEDNINSHTKISKAVSEQIEGLETKLVWETKDLTVLEKQVERRVQSVKLIDKAKTGAVKTVFAEKRLIGLLEKKIQLKKAQINFENHLQKLTYLTGEEKAASYERELKLYTELEDNKERLANEKRKNWVIAEKVRLDKAIRKNAFALADGKNATFEYVNSEGEYVKYTKKQADDYRRRLDDDYNEYVLKNASIRATAIMNKEIDTARDAFNAKLKYNLDYQSEINRLGKEELDNNISRLTGELNGGIISLASFYKRRFELEDKHKRDLVKSNLETAKKNVDILATQLESEESMLNKMLSFNKKFGFKLYTDEEITKQKALLNTLIEASEDANKEINKAIKASVDLSVKDTEDSVKRAILAVNKITDIMSGIDALAEQLHARKMMRLDEEQQKVDDTYAKNIELAKNDANAKEALAKQKAITDAKLDKQRRELEIKAAKRSKAFAIMDIGLKTAQSIMSASLTQPWLPLGPIMMAAAAANGAVQLAAAIATPIPKLKEGREGGKATHAIVGDGGRHEVIERKDGTIQLTPKTDTLMWLNKDDKVHKSIPDFERKLKLKNNDDKIKKDLEDALINGLEKAKINNTNIIHTPNLDLEYMMWVNSQSQLN
jgi:hypothetical protein